MSKAAESLQRRFGSNLSESLGVRAGTPSAGSSMPGAFPRETSPDDGWSGSGTIRSTSMCPASRARVRPSSGLVSRGNAPAVRAPPGAIPARTPGSRAR